MQGKYNMFKRYVKIVISCLMVTVMMCLAGCLSLNLNIDLNNDNKIKDLFSEKPQVSINKDIPSFENDATCFSRNYILNNRAKVIYDVVYDSLLKNKTEIDFSNVGGGFSSQEEMKVILSESVYSVLRDHPQFFMYSGAYTYEFSEDLMLSSVVLKMKTVIDEKDAQEKQKEIDEVVDKLVADTKEMDDYNKSKYIYTYIAQNTTYKESENAHNMYGCLVEGVSVCEGYAKAYSYIMQKCGMQVAYVTGMGKNELHAWNLINIDNNWYHIDCTWGDPVTEIEDPEQKRLNVDYSYLHLTTENILVNHTLDDFYENLPKCISVEANYHNVEGIYLKSYSDAELRNIIKNKVYSTSNFKQVCISIKYALPSDAKKANKWIEDGNIKEVLEDLPYSSYSYSWSYTDVGTIDIKLSFKF